MSLIAFVDDSASSEDDRELVLAGYFADRSTWQAFTHAWELALHEEPFVDYFHASEAESLKKQFANPIGMQKFSD